jgi:hypothetical protein
MSYPGCYIDIERYSVRLLVCFERSEIMIWSCPKIKLKNKTLGSTRFVCPYVITPESLNELLLNVYTAEFFYTLSTYCSFDHNRTIVIEHTREDLHSFYSCINRNSLNISEGKTCFKPTL